MVAFYAVLAGDSEGQKRIENLYYSYRKQMFFVANALLNDTYEAENAVHDAFVGIAVSIDKVPKNEQDERLYVLTCARNAASKLEKKRRRYSAEINIDDLNEADLMVADAVFESVAASENMELLKRAIARLPDIYRDVLLLHCVYDMKVKDMAQLLGRKAATAEKQLARARAALCRLCAEEGMVFANEKSSVAI